MLWATLRARFGPNAARPFWFGFAAFGWAHLLLLDSPYHETLPTAVVVEQILRATWDQTRSPTRSNEEWVVIHEVIRQVAITALTWCSLIAGLIGGVIARRLGRAESVSSAERPATYPGG